MYSYVIKELHGIMTEKMEQENTIDLFNNIEMPLVQVLADMQYEGMYVDKDELLKYGDELKFKIDNLTKEIHELSGEEFNINSPKQLRRGTF